MNKKEIHEAVADLETLLASTVSSRNYRCTSDCYRINGPNNFLEQGNSGYTRKINCRGNFLEYGNWAPARRSAGLLLAFPYPSTVFGAPCSIVFCLWDTRTWIALASRGADLGGALWFCTMFIAKETRFAEELEHELPDNATLSTLEALGFPKARRRVRNIHMRWTGLRTCSGAKATGSFTSAPGNGDGSAGASSTSASFTSHARMHLDLVWSVCLASWVNHRFCRVLLHRTFGIQRQCTFSARRASPCSDKCAGKRVLALHCWKHHFVTLRAERLFQWRSIWRVSIPIFVT